MNLHHANIVLAKRDSLDFVHEILKRDLGIKLSGNPDFLFIESDSFGIDEARHLEKWAHLKPFSGDIKASLIVANSLGWEAQNALLKIFEEPVSGTYFFVMIENLVGILPTFLSRVRILDKRGDGDDLKAKKAKEFIKADIKKRLSTIRSMSNSEDKSDMKELISHLESVAYRDKSEPEKIKKILKAKVFASLRGSSPRMILEWLACVI